METPSTASGKPPTQRADIAASRSCAVPERAIVGRRKVAHAFNALGLGNRAGRATASWSENGSTGSPTIWPVSWPLPATSSTSPACSSPTAVRIASARSPISSAPGAAARIAARIAAGSSDARIVVGDDDDVGLRRRDLAHHRPLAAIAVAAAAEHADEPARRVGPQRVQHIRQRVGLVGVVDEDQRAVDARRRAPAAPWRRSACAQRGHARATCPRPPPSPARPRPARWRPGNRPRAAGARRSVGPRPRRSSAWPNPSRVSEASAERLPARPTVISFRPRALTAVDDLLGVLAVGVDDGRRASGSSVSNRRSLAASSPRPWDDSRGGRGRDW